ARRGGPRRGHRAAARRAAAGYHHRRRPGRRHHGRRRQRAARAGPAGPRGGWLAAAGQPGRGPDNYHCGAAVRVVIAEASVLRRGGLPRLATEGGFEAVAAVADGRELMAAVARHQPDLVVVDVRMPPTHTDEGIRAALAIRQAHPGTAVLVLSAYVEESY